MQEDFSARPNSVGTRPCTWTLAGIADALAEGEAHRARAMAMALLGLAAIDQAAVDSGSWILANGQADEALGRQMDDGANGPHSGERRF